MKNPICYCGHDCSRCKTYLATIHDDMQLRVQSQMFYKETFGITIPLAEMRCLGGHSGDVFVLCRECPFMKCCKEHGMDTCAECETYPCRELKQYQEQYVNQCNQITACDAEQNRENVVKKL